MSTFLGYERENGRVGIRNHVLVIPLDDLSNSAAVGVEHLIHGTRAVPHPYGRLQFGDDLDLMFKTLSGFGKNPNVASAIVIGIEDKWASKVADEIAKTGKHVETVGIEGNGDLRTVEKASRLARYMVQDASEKHRKQFDASSLVVSTKCGESDTTSGLASNPTVGANSKCFSISFAVRRPEAVFSDSSCNFLPASLRSYSNLSSPDTSRSMCSLIVLTVFGFADSLITGSIGFPMMLPCPVVKR